MKKTADESSKSEPNWNSVSQICDTLKERHQKSGYEQQSQVKFWSSWMYRVWMPQIPGFLKFKGNPCVPKLWHFPSAITISGSHCYEPWGTTPRLTLPALLLTLWTVYACMLHWHSWRPPQHCPGWKPACWNYYQTIWDHSLQCWPLADRQHSVWCRWTSLDDINYW